MAGDTFRNADPVDSSAAGLAASLLFAPGRRPNAGDVQHAAQGGDFHISFDPAAAGDGAEGAQTPALAVPHDGVRWLELVASGMTFDLAGLAPGHPSPSPCGELAPGLAGIDDADQLEALSLRSGPHLAGGGAMMPVIRCLALLAAHLAELPGLRAVAWHPARQWTSPQHFRSSVLRWIDGGVFPGLALVSLAPSADGGLASRGLALFIGREIQLRPALVTDRAAAAKLALRLMHWLVDRGGVDGPEQVTGPDGERLIVEPGAGRILVVRRG